MSDSIVIIPTYNERENILAIIEAVFSLSKSFHLLIVDDNSPDGTAEIVKTLQERFNKSVYRLHLLLYHGQYPLMFYYNLICIFPT